MKISELTARYNENIAKVLAAIQKNEEREKELREQATQLRHMADTLEGEADATKSERFGMQTVSWVDEIIRPMAESIAKKKGKKAEIMGPRGICFKVTIILHSRNDGDCFMEWSEKEILTVEPQMDGSEPRMYYETGEKKERFAPGSIGAINGLNNVTAVLPDDECEVAALFRREPCWREMEEETK